MATPTLDLIINIADPQAQGLLANVNSEGVGALPQIFDLESQLVRILAVKPHAADFTQFWDVVDLTSAVVEVAIGVASQPPTAGTFDVLTAEDLAVAITQAALQTALSTAVGGTGVTVEQVGGLGSGAYTVQWNSNGAQSLLTGDGNNSIPVSTLNAIRLQAGTSGQPEIQMIWLEQAPCAYTNAFANDGVLAGSMSATLVCATAAMLEQFAGNDDDIISSLFFSVRITLPGQTPQTILRIPVNIARAVINVTNISGILSPLQEQFYPLITALTGDTSTTLDGLGTVQLPLLFIAKFVLAGKYAVYQLQAGAAGTDDVAPADYNPSTNIKKWVSLS